MPRPLLHQDRQTAAQSPLTLHSETTAAAETRTAQSQQQIDRLLRKQRSQRYMEAIHRLDAGGHVMNDAEIQAILADIRAEFPDLVQLGGIFIGLIAKCYLGDPYEVHTLSFTQSIVHHYQRGEALPDGMERARAIAARGGYEFIEVYTDCCRAVSADGSVAVIR